MKIKHITIQTGHVSLIEKGDVKGETIARVAPWLSALANSGRSMPLPTAALSKFTAHAVFNDGCFLVTISGSAGNGSVFKELGLPLVTLAGCRNGDGKLIWDLMTQNQNKHIEYPGDPWCAAIIQPGVVSHPDSLEWLGDLERCIAWCFCFELEAK